MSKCLKSKNYDFDDGGIYPVCIAFPHGIPRDIFGGRIIHDKPYPRDNGIRFENK